jgi:hypothetical protein
MRNLLETPFVKQTGFLISIFSYQLTSCRILIRILKSKNYDAFKYYAIAYSADLSVRLPQNCTCNLEEDWYAAIESLKIEHSKTGNIKANFLNIKNYSGGLINKFLVPFKNQKLRLFALFYCGVATGSAGKSLNLFFNLQPVLTDGL